jgi:hypothetical protein
LQHLRTDYDRIQDPATERPELATHGQPIGVDEPVFLLRGRDMNAAATVRLWADLTENRGGDPRLVAAVRAWADHMSLWGATHGTKVPDTPPEVIRDPAELG